LTRGSVVGNLVAMSVPTMVGMLGQTLYDVVDLVWVGRISAKAVAGVSLFSSIFWLAEILNEIIGTSSVALITQSFGSGDRGRANRVIEQTIVFKVAVALVAAALMFVGLEPLVRFFSSDPEVVRAALEYGRIRIFFLPVFFATYSCFTALRCSGDPASQMWIMLLVSVLNAALDPILMFERVPLLGTRGFGLGVYGAGLATVISITAAFALGFGLLSGGRRNVRLSVRGLFRLDPKIDAKLMTIGLPSGGEMLARQLAGLVTTKFVASYGTAAIAALGIGNRLGGLVFMPLFGLLSGGGTIIGQNLGAENVERAEKTARAASLLGGGAVTLAMGLAIAFPEPVLRVFVDSPETIAVGVPMIRLLGASFIVVSFAIALGSAFSGSGYNLPFLVSSLAGRWGAQVPFLALSAFVLPRAGLELGILGVWASFLVSDLVEAGVLVAAFRKGKWKEHRV
ncbi:MAG TPA: MATE family efflux transporter, partial [Spirochaetia bacterium]|nr:MATE family efflux transporter [Spirochaetia bacterium]